MTCLCITYPALHIGEFRSSHSGGDVFASGHDMTVGTRDNITRHVIDTVFEPSFLPSIRVP